MYKPGVLRLLYAKYAVRSSSKSWVELQGLDFPGSLEQINSCMVYWWHLVRSCGSWFIINYSINYLINFSNNNSGAISCWSLLNAKQIERKRVFTTGKRRQLSSLASLFISRNHRSHQENTKVTGRAVLFGNVLPFILPEAWNLDVNFWYFFWS